MKTTKKEIKDRLMNEDHTLTDYDVQKFVDDLFPATGMNDIVYTDDD